jgi:hypothetical protein
VGWYLLLFVVFGGIFTVSTYIMGFEPKQFVPGFLLIFVVSVLTLVVSQSEFFHKHSLEAAINVPLGYFLSTVVFRDYWMAVP